MGRPHRVIYYNAVVRTIPAMKQAHEYKCPLCSNYNPEKDACTVLEIEGLLTVERLRIVFCFHFSLGEYKEKQVVKRKPRRLTMVVVGYDEKDGLPILEVRRRRH